VVDDIVFPQLRRTAKRIVGMLGEADFRTLGHGVWAGDDLCGLFLELEVWSLPPIRKIRGPPVFSHMHSEQFIKKYGGKNRLWVEDGIWVAEAKREHVDAARMLRMMLKGDAKRLEGLGIASYIASSLSKGFSISEDSEAIRAACRQKESASLLADFFSRSLV
jgi:tRNA nucleotidyltransferase (CCA-adding enzyme)